MRPMPLRMLRRLLLMPLLMPALLLPMRALLLPMRALLRETQRAMPLLLRTMLLLPRATRPLPPRKKLLRRSKPTANGLIGRADGAVHPRLPPADLFPEHEMPITIREARASQADRDWIEDTYGEYLADLTADTTGVFPSLTITGQSVSEIIQGWFHDDRCTAFVVLREQEPVGFAVVQRSLAGSEDPKRHYRLSEFFIRRPFRSKGVGRGAAMLIFARYAGEWTIAEQSRNPGAIRFWRRVVSEFTNGKFHEKRGQGEIAHSFTSAGPVNTPAR